METPLTKDSQELQFSGLSENRKKLDGFQLIETANPQYMETVVEILWQGEEKCLQSESKCDLRKSLAWDSAFFTSPGVLDHEELFETLNFRDVENAVHVPGQGEHNFLPSVPFEPERTSRIGECNVRRSLAWDSAFFSNPGVLDPEELSLVNKGFKKSERCILPEIEEFWRSADSNSTVDSGSFSLASLEIDLFDDIRVSSLKSSRVFNVAASTVKSGRGMGMQDIRCSKELDGSARRRIKSVPPSKRQSTNKHGKEMISKETSLKMRAQHAVQCGESKPLSSLKPPKGSRGPNILSTAPTKRAPLGPDHVEMENKNSKAACGQGMTMLKKPCLGDTSSVIPGSTPAQKSPLSGSPSIANESAWSGFASFDSTGKSLPNSLRRKTDSRLTASDSAFKTPLRNFIGSNKFLSSTQRSHLLPTPKSSCTSPASSTDGWSSESTNSGNQRSCSSTASLDIYPCKGVLFDSEAFKASDHESLHPDQPCVEQESHEERLLDYHIDKISVGITHVPTNVPRDIKPSGLRMPSPKIGFFDVGNSLALTPNGGLKFHSGLQSICVNRRSINDLNGGTANRRRYGKPRSAGTLTGTGGKKVGPQQNGRVPCPPLSNRGSPAKFEEVGNNSQKASTTFSAATRSRLATSSKNQSDLSCELSNGEPFGAAGLETNLRVEDNRIPWHRKNKMDAKSDRKVHLRIKKQSSKQCDDGIENNLHTHCDGEKENKCSLENQVDNLSRHIEAIDFTGIL